MGNHASRHKPSKAVKARHEFACDNQRYAPIDAGVTEIPVEWPELSTIQRYISHFATGNGGFSILLVLLG